MILSSLLRNPPGFDPLRSGLYRCCVLNFSEYAETWMMAACLMEGPLIENLNYDFEIALIQVKVFGYQTLNLTVDAWANLRTLCC